MPDELITVGRDEIAVRLTTAETGGRLLALDVAMPPGGGPPGLHRHAAAEVYRVLDGELTVYLGDERVPAPAGTVFHIEGGRAHTIRNESDAPARGYVTFIGDAEPMERFLRSAASGEDVMTLAARHGIESVPVTPRFAVVGHVEWIEFALVSHVPVAGEIIDARSSFHEPAGSAAVAAVQLAKLAGGVDFFTAIGNDERGRRSETRLGELGVTVHAAWRDAPTRWGFVHLDDAGERTITVVGDRLAAQGADDLPWDRLEGADAVFVSGGDEAAMRQARRARLLVATPRAAGTLGGIQVDALVGSRNDGLEQIAPLDPPPRLEVWTRGAEGGEYTGGTWAAAPLPGPLVDAYGAGDTFAAGLTYALGAGYETKDALAFAARAGAANLTGRGPYEGQLKGV